MNENTNTKQYFIHNSVKIIVTEHFNNNGKSFEDIIKDAIVRDAKTVTND